MAKKEFSWDSEKIIGEVQESEKVKHEIKVCELNGKAFVVSTKWVLKKDGWGIVKNQTFERGVFDEIVKLV
jgi:hypothetical protein